MRPRASLVVLLAAALVASAASAAVRFEEFTRETFQQRIVDRAAREGRAVVAVVTQPDWCPPCIKLDQRWLQNPGDESVASTTRGSLVVEIHGYDEGGAALLADQGVRFVGTPTVLVFRPTEVGRPLGQARLAGSVVGAPDDFPERLAALFAGADRLADARLAATDAVGDAAKGEALLQLAGVHVERGDADAAREALDEAAALAPVVPGLQAKVDRQRIFVTLRVDKDYPQALRLVRTYREQHGEGSDAAGLAYDEAWCLAHLGREDEALAVADKAFLQEGDDEGLETFAYLAFRCETPKLLARAERALRDALARSPEKAPSLTPALARVLRREGRLREAEALFARAVELAPSDAARVTQQGQLVAVRQELVERFQPPERKPLSLQFVGYEPQGPIGFTFGMFVLPGALICLAFVLALLTKPLKA